MFNHLQLGYRPKFHILDVTVPESVKKLRDHILEEYGGLDVLINNAAIVCEGEIAPIFIEKVSSYCIILKSLIRIIYCLYFRFDD